MIIISPYSRRLRNGQENPKNYPHWKEVVKALKAQGHRVIQIGSINEPLIGADELLIGLPLKGLAELLGKAQTWTSVDNFFPHFCALYQKPGVVVWGKSDPKIFGYPQNENLLKSRDNLRHNQFDIWESESFDPKVFVPAKAVVAAIEKLAARF